MKVSIKWLKDFVDINIPATEIAEKLTMAGLEVKDVDIIGGNLENVLIGKILAINPHPNADRLTLPTIDLGTEQVTVVCGAPNLKIGDKIAFAKVGAKLIDGHTGEPAVLKPAKIRGVVSAGMVCSEKELGISENHEGIMVLSPDAPIGMPLGDYIGDTVFNLEVTPNRPDCLSVIGIAREIAALTGQQLHIPEINYPEEGSSITGQVKVEIKDPDLCPRYCASLITGVKIADSPQWMQRRLLASGQRPINNVVDVTNYVMLEYGQPLHSFDYIAIAGKHIIVRRAADGELIDTLDGVERKLSSDMLVIADEKGAVAVAGVMGGANSEILLGTTSILLEAASFNPKSIHYTSRKLGLPSEASARFERGVTAEMTIPALRRATQLISVLGGGQAAKGIVDVYPGKVETKPIRLTAAKTKQVLGVDYSVDRMADALTALGFECKKADSGVEATAPYWRADIHLQEDLIEEIARVTGFDKIPMTMLSQPIPRQQTQPLVALKDSIKRCLVGYGFQEIMSYSLTGLDALNKLYTQPCEVQPPPIRIANPMSAEQEYMRPNLRVGVLSALAANKKHDEGGIRIFELNKIYISKPEGLPDERDMLCGVISGPAAEKSWNGGGEQPDFFEAKGVVQALFCSIGITANFEKSADESFHATKQAAIVVDGNRIGVIGELHPKVLENFEITEPGYLFELDVVALLPLATGHRMYRPIPRFPAVVRDIALVVDTGVIHQQIVDIIKGFPLVEQVNIFDIYSGEQVAGGKKSLAYRITYQSPAHTLTDEEVNKVQQQILDRLAKDFGATLRA